MISNINFDIIWLTMKPVMVDDSIQQSYESWFEIVKDIY